MENPYRSPQSVVGSAELEPIQSRSRWVWIALNIAYGAFALLIFTVAIPRGLRGSDFVALGALLTPLLALERLTTSGKGAGRFLLALAATGPLLCLGLFAFALVTDGFESVSLIALAPVCIFAVNLIATRPNNSSKPTPLRGAA